jgi:hypothetical protein
MSIFASLYLDEDVSVLVATLLRARGFDAVTAVESGMLGQGDEFQLVRAAAMGRCVVTHNRVHFERLHRQYVETDQHHNGIIVAVRRNPYEVTRRLAILLDTLTADELCDQLLYC